ncbi:MAG: helix-turn-helix transcriptional regulator [Lachnospiraceae bacterium]|nr:helix-turn-helix transcriptional regulator [Lachnospiraceae bacterium]
MEDILKTMGQRIVCLRKEQNWTQEYLSQISGVSSQTISNAERGVKALRPENIVKLSQAFQVSTDYILTGHRNSADYLFMEVKLSTLTQKQSDRMMRAIKFLLEED